MLNSFNARIMAYTDFTEYYIYLVNPNISMFNVKDHLLFRLRVFVVK